MARSYAAFHTWAEETIEPVRSEIVSLLYPVFAHAYLRLKTDDEATAAEFLERWTESHSNRYTEELKDLGTTVLKEEGSYGWRLQRCKFVVRLGAVAAELVGDYLTRTANVCVIRVINEHVKIEIVDDAKAIGRSELATLIDDDDGENIEEEPEKKRKREVVVSAATARKAGVGATKGRATGTEVHLGSLAESLVDAEPASATKVPPSFWGQADPETNAYAAAMLRDHTRRKLTGNVQQSGGEGSRSRPRLSALEPVALMATVVGGDADQVSCMKPSRDATRIAAGFSDSTVRVWRLDAVARRDGARASNGAAHRGPVYACAWSAEARFLLTSAADGCAVLWDTGGVDAKPGAQDGGLNRQSSQLPGPPGGLSRARTMSDDLSQQHQHKPRALARYRAHGGRPAFDVAWSDLASGRLFATAGGDRTCRLFATDRVDPLRIFVGHWGEVLKVKWHPNAHYLLTASVDKSLRLWDVRARGDGVRCARILDGGGVFSAIDLSPDGKYAAAADHDGKLHLWHLDSGRPIASGGDVPGVHALAFSNAGAALATGGRDNSVNIWDANAIHNDTNNFFAAPRHTFRTKSTPVFDLTWTFGNLCIVSGPLLV